MSTANICLSYAVETMAGVRPTSGYIMMPDITEVPISNALLLVNDLYFVAFYTDRQLELWQELIEAYNNAIKQGLSVWFCISHPKLDIDTANFFQGKPLSVKPAYTLGNYSGIALPVVPLSAVEQAKNPLKIGSVDYEKNAEEYRQSQYAKGRLHKD